MKDKQCKKICLCSEICTDINGKIGKHTMKCKWRKQREANFSLLLKGDEIEIKV